MLCYVVVVVVQLCVVSMHIWHKTYYLGQREAPECLDPRTLATVRKTATIHLNQNEGVPKRGVAVSATQGPLPREPLQCRPGVTAILGYFLN